MNTLKLIRHFEGRIDGHCIMMNSSGSDFEGTHAKWINRLRVAIVYLRQRMDRADRRKADYLEARNRKLPITQAQLYAEWLYDDEREFERAPADDTREFYFEIARRSVLAGQNARVLEAIRINRMLRSMTLGDCLARGERSVERVAKGGKCSDGKLRRLGVCGAFLAGHNPAGFGMSEMGVIE